MQSFYKRFSVISGFAVLLAVLVANAFFTRRKIDVLVQTQAGVAHTRQVLYELSQTESLLKDAETGQRGFLYTGDSKYLAPYNAAVSQIGPHLDNLDKLTEGNARQQALMPRLRDTATLKLTELARTIELFRAGREDEAAKFVLSDVGLRHMTEIRQIMAQMQDEETTIEAVRTEQYQASIRGTITSVYLASFLAVLGLVLLAYYILREMATREKHAAEIRAREQWFRVTLTSIGDAVIATDEHGKVTFLNPVAEKLTGKTLAEARGRPVREVFPIVNEVTRKPVEDPVKKVLELGTVVGLANHTVIERSDGALIPIEDSAAPIRGDHGGLLGVVLVFRDVTQERKTQEVMRRTEKLAAAARLSATVAHEINNPLEAVVNLIFIARQADDASPGVVHALDLADQELQRVAHITRQTLGFFRESNAPEAVSIPALIESVLKLYSNRLKNKNIRVERDFGHCPPIYGMPGELEQAVSNLLSNAADAVGHDGTIVVRARCVENSASASVEMIVEDDGPGIASENVDRIFEPFFTTKEDVGTGLGLWITKEIVSRHGGNILVRARANGETRGAAFTVTLPVNAESAMSLPGAANGAPGGTA